jgi:lanosterol synthase
MSAELQPQDVGRETEHPRRGGLTTREAAQGALSRAVRHLQGLQNPQGGWEAEMVWNTMILSQYIIVNRTVGRPIAPAAAARMIQHYRVTRTPQGGWGMHGECDNYVFFTALAYVSLRLLGVPPSDPLCADARAWLHRQRGGVLHIPTWGKLWLAFCGLYEYEGINPFPPELFLLPHWLPIAPTNFYCHTRYVYLGIAYLYGRRFRSNLGPIVEELRRELYEQPDAKPYAELDFSQYRHRIAATDLYVAPSATLRFAYDLLYAIEGRRGLFGWLREGALGYCLERILYEQRMSRYQGISPVNGLLNCLALYSQSPHHPDLEPSLIGLEAWKWEDEWEGIRYCGARSNSWDTAFALQALNAAPASVLAQPAVQKTLLTGHAYLCSLQMQEELSHPEYEHRERIQGGFCFSDGQHRWPVSDCTAEALAALMETEERCGGAIEQPLCRDRLQQAVRFLLSRQNADGGFGTYEPRRGHGFLEHVNPSEIYGSCMTERSYLECTSSALCGLAAVRAHAKGRLGPPLGQAAELAIKRGVSRLFSAQLPDGSFPGFWGINFTYAIFHVIKALRAVGIPRVDTHLQRAAAWLISKQRKDGGWSESWKSCLEDRYIEHRESQVVMTSWALLALLELRNPAAFATADDGCIALSIERGIAFLCKQQLEDGGFPQQAQNGVFFGTAMLDYRMYKSYFPTWALARYSNIPSAGR